MATLFVLVPVFNEEPNIPTLMEAFAQLSREMAPRFDCRFLMVDDGSGDGTADVHVDALVVALRVGEGKTGKTVADTALDVAFLHDCVERGAGAGMRGQAERRCGEDGKSCSSYRLHQTPPEGMGYRLSKDTPGRLGRVDSGGCFKVFRVQSGFRKMARETTDTGQDWAT